MPTNNFKLFDQNKANLLTDTEYANATQRLNGVQTGVASSQLNNKFSYQVSLVAYAQIMNQNGFDATDTLAVSAFVGNLGGSLLQKVADKASTAEAAAGVLTNKYISPATMKAAALLLSGGTMTGPIDMGNHKITGLGTPTADSDAATKGYADSLQIFRNRDLYFAHHDSSSVPYINLSNKLNYSNVIQSGLNGLYIELSDIDFTYSSNGKIYIGISSSKGFSSSVDYWVYSNLWFNSSVTNFPMARQVLYLEISINNTDGNYVIYESRTGLALSISDSFYLFLKPVGTNAVIKCNAHVWAF